ncbi:MAG: high frequency lysogenization protein HflD [Candidatus Nitrosotenuis sp.]
MEEILTQIGQLSPVFVMGLGLTIGLQHAFEPDHVAAVSTQISKGRFTHSTKQAIKTGTLKSSALGALWGAGHTTTLVLMGLLVYGLAVKIQQNIFSSFEFVVGLMLVFLAVITILNKRIKFTHRHPHQHQDGTIHFDEHNHNDYDHKHGHKSYLIGCIHGLAGSGSLVILTAATLSNATTVIGFILLFGIGSILGMALISGLMWLPFALSSKTSLIGRIFRYTAGALSLIIGANILYQVGFIENLFGL